LAMGVARRKELLQLLDDFLLLLRVERGQVAEFDALEEGVETGGIRQ